MFGGAFSGFGAQLFGNWRFRAKRRFRTRVDSLAFSRFWAFLENFEGACGLEPSLFPLLQMAARLYIWCFLTHLSFFVATTSKRFIRASRHRDDGRHYLCLLTMVKRVCNGNSPTFWWVQRLRSAVLVVIWFVQWGSWHMCCVEISENRQSVPTNCGRQ